MKGGGLGLAGYVKGVSLDFEKSDDHSNLQFSAYIGTPQHCDANVKV